MNFKKLHIETQKIVIKGKGNFTDLNKILTEIQDSTSLSEETKKGIIMELIILVPRREIRESEIIKKILDTLKLVGYKDIQKLEEMIDTLNKEGL